MKGSLVLPFGKKFIGNKYVFGAYVKKDNDKYDGVFDCAEFVAYCNYQVFSILYGTEGNTLKKDDAYTGYFARDVEKYGIKISVEQAARTPGAILLRVPKLGAIGHIVFSQGNGKTVEAHSTKYGVKEDKVDGRRWDYGFLLPNVEYTENKAPVITSAPKIVYRLKTPMMSGDYVKTIQKGLQKAGFYLGWVPDVYFGPKMQDAVVKYQKKYGLIADGEVMPAGEVEKSLRKNKFII